MKSIFDLTPEEKKRANPDAIKFMIETDEQMLKVWSLPDYRKQEIEAELKCLRNLLKEVT